MRIFLLLLLLGTASAILTTNNGCPCTSVCTGTCPVLTTCHSSGKGTCVITSLTVTLQSSLNRLFSSGDPLSFEVEGSGDNVTTHVIMKPYTPAPGVPANYTLLHTLDRGVFHVTLPGNLSTIVNQYSLQLVKTTEHTGATVSAPWDGSLLTMLNPTPTETASPSVSRTGTRSKTGTPSTSKSLSATGSNTATPSSTPTDTKSSTSTPTNTKSSTSTPSNTRSPAVTPTETKTQAASPSGSATPAEKVTSSSTASRTITGSITPSISFTPTRTPSRSLSGSNSATVTATASHTTSNTRTSSKTASGTPTGLRTPSNTASGSVSPSVTRTSSCTASQTPSTSMTSSVTRTVTQTPSFTASATRTSSFTPSAPKTPSFTASATRTSSFTPSAQKTPPVTVSATKTASQSETSGVTPSKSMTPSKTASQTNTGSVSSSVTATSSRTASQSLSGSRSPTTTASQSRTSTATRTGTRSPPGTQAPTRTPSTSRTSTHLPSGAVATPSASSSASATQPSRTGTSTGSATQPSMTETSTGSATQPSMTETSTGTATAAATQSMTGSVSTTGSATQTVTGSAMPASKSPTRTISSTPSPLPPRIWFINPSPASAQNTTKGVLFMNVTVTLSWDTFGVPMATTHDLTLKFLCGSPNVDPSLIDAVVLPAETKEYGYFADPTKLAGRLNEVCWFVIGSSIFRVAAKSAPLVVRPPPPSVSIIRPLPLTEVAMSTLGNQFASFPFTVQIIGVSGPGYWMSVTAQAAGQQKLLHRLDLQPTMLKVPLSMQLKNMFATPLVSVEVSIFDNSTLASQASVLYRSVLPAMTRSWLRFSPGSAAVTTRLLTIGLQALNVGAPIHVDAGVVVDGRRVWAAVTKPEGFLPASNWSTTEIRYTFLQTLGWTADVLLLVYCPAMNLQINTTLTPNIPTVVRPTWPSEFDVDPLTLFRSKTYEISWVPLVDIKTVATVAVSVEFQCNATGKVCSLALLNATQLSQAPPAVWLQLTPTLLTDFAKTVVFSIVSNANGQLLELRSPTYSLSSNPLTLLHNADDAIAGVILPVQFSVDNLAYGNAKAYFECRNAERQLKVVGEVKFDLAPSVARAPARPFFDLYPSVDESNRFSACRIVVDVLSGPLSMTSIVSAEFRVFAPPQSEQPTIAVVQTASTAYNTISVAWTTDGLSSNDLLYFEVVHKQRLFIVYPTGYPAGLLNAQFQPPPGATGPMRVRVYSRAFPSAFAVLDIDHDPNILRILFPNTNAVALGLNINAVWQCQGWPAQTLGTFTLSSVRGTYARALAESTSLQCGAQAARNFFSYLSLDIPSDVLTEEGPFQLVMQVHSATPLSVSSSSFDITPPRSISNSDEGITLVWPSVGSIMPISSTTVITWTADNLQQPEDLVVETVVRFAQMPGSACHVDVVKSGVGKSSLTLPGDISWIGSTVDVTIYSLSTPALRVQVQDLVITPPPVISVIEPAILPQKPRVVSPMKLTWKATGLGTSPTYRLQICAARRCTDLRVLSEERFSATNTISSDVMIPWSVSTGMFPYVFRVRSEVGGYDVFADSQPFDLEPGNPNDGELLFAQPSTEISVQLTEKLSYTLVTVGISTHTIQLRLKCAGGVMTAEVATLQPQNCSEARCSWTQFALLSSAFTANEHLFQECATNSNDLHGEIRYNLVLEAVAENTSLRAFSGQIMLRVSPPPFTLEIALPTPEGYILGGVLHFKVVSNNFTGPVVIMLDSLSDLMRRQPIFQLDVEIGVTTSNFTFPLDTFIPIEAENSMFISLEAFFQEQSVAVPSPLFTLRTPPAAVTFKVPYAGSQYQVGQPMYINLGTQFIRQPLILELRFANSESLVLTTLRDVSSSVIYVHPSIPKPPSALLSGGSLQAQLFVRNFDSTLYFEGPIITVSDPVRTLGPIDVRRVDLSVGPITAGSPLLVIWRLSGIPSSSQIQVYLRPTGALIDVSRFILIGSTAATAVGKLQWQSPQRLAPGFYNVMMQVDGLSAQSQAFEVKKPLVDILYDPLPPSVQKLRTLNLAWSATPPLPVNISLVNALDRAFSMGISTLSPPTGALGWVVPLDLDLSAAQYAIRFSMDGPDRPFVIITPPIQILPLSASIEVQSPATAAVFYPGQTLQVRWSRDTLPVQVSQLQLEVRAAANGSRPLLWAVVSATTNVYNFVVPPLVSSQAGLHFLRIAAVHFAEVRGVSGVFHLLLPRPELSLIDLRSNFSTNGSPSLIDSPLTFMEGDSISVVFSSMSIEGQCIIRGELVNVITSESRNVLFSDKLNTQTNAIITPAHLLYFNATMTPAARSSFFLRLHVLQGERVIAETTSRPLTILPRAPAQAFVSILQPSTPVRVIEGSSIIVSWASSGIKDGEACSLQLVPSGQQGSPLVSLFVAREGTSQVQIPLIADSPSTLYAFVIKCSASTFARSPAISIGKRGTAFAFLRPLPLSVSSVEQPLLISWSATNVSGPIGFVLENTALPGWSVLVGSFDAAAAQMLWTLPDNIATNVMTRDTYVLRASNAEFSALSAKFSIYPARAQITVLAPAALSTLIRGQPVKVRYQAEGVVGSISISLVNPVLLKSIELISNAPPAIDALEVVIPLDVMSTVDAESSWYLRLAATSGGSTVSIRHGPLTIQLPTSTAAFLLPAPNSLYTHGDTMRVGLSVPQELAAEPTILTLKNRKCSYRAPLSRRTFSEPLSYFDLSFPDDAPTDYTVRDWYYLEVSGRNGSWFSISNMFSISAVPAALQVIEPQQDAAFVRGGSLRMTWRSVGIFGKVLCELVNLDNGFKMVMGEMDAINSEFIWRIPASFPLPTAQLRGRYIVRAVDRTNPQLVGLSATFSIIPPEQKIRIIAPAEVQHGRRFMVAWTASNFRASEYLLISLERDNGERVPITAISVATNVSNTCPEAAVCGSASILIDNDILAQSQISGTTQWQLLVANLQDDHIQARSPAFSIRPPAQVAVIFSQPLPNSVFRAGKDRVPVAWSYTQAPPRLPEFDAHVLCWRRNGLVPIHSFGVISSPPGEFAPAVTKVPLDLSDCAVRLRDIATNASFMSAPFQLRPLQPRMSLTVTSARVGATGLPAELFPGERLNIEANIGIPEGAEIRNNTLLLRRRLLTAESIIVTSFALSRSATIFHTATMPSTLTNGEYFMELSTTIAGFDVPFTTRVGPMLVQPLKRSMRITSPSQAVSTSPGASIEVRYSTVGVPAASTVSVTLNDVAGPFMMVLSRQQRNTGLVVARMPDIPAALDGHTFVIEVRTEDGAAISASTPNIIITKRQRSIWISSPGNEVQALQGGQEIKIQWGWHGLQRGVHFMRIELWQDRYFALGGDQLLMVISNKTALDDSSYSWTLPVDVPDTSPVYVRVVVDTPERMWARTSSMRTSTPGAGGLKRVHDSMCPMGVAANWVEQDLRPLCATTCSDCSKAGGVWTTAASVFFDLIVHNWAADESGLNAFKNHYGAFKARGANLCWPGNRFFSGAIDLSLRLNKPIPTLAAAVNISTGGQVRLIGHSITLQGLVIEDSGCKPRPIVRGNMMVALKSANDAVVDNIQQQIQHQLSTSRLPAEKLILSVRPITSGGAPSRRLQSGCSAAFTSVEYAMIAADDATAQDMAELPLTVTTESDTGMCTSLPSNAIAYPVGGLSVLNAEIVEVNVAFESASTGDQPMSGDSTDFFPVSAFESGAYAYQQEAMLQREEEQSLATPSDAITAGDGFDFYTAALVGGILFGTAAVIGLLLWAGTAVKKHWQVKRSRTTKKVLDYSNTRASHHMRNDSDVVNVATTNPLHRADRIQTDFTPQPLSGGGYRKSMAAGLEREHRRSIMNRIDQRTGMV